MNPDVPLKPDGVSQSLFNEALGKRYIHCFYVVRLSDSNIAVWTADRTQLVYLGQAVQFNLAKAVAEYVPPPKKPVFLRAPLAVDFELDLADLGL